MSITYLPKNQIKHEVKKRIAPSLSAIDIGCGIRPSTIISTKQHICIEPFSEYVDVIKKLVPYEHIILIQANWEEGLALFPDKSIDTIIFTDVIEHLIKHDGIRLLQESKRVAKKQIVLFTPLGFMPQLNNSNGCDAWGYNGGKYQEHKSGWDESDFDSTWDLFVCKEFHYYDNDGIKFDKPYGAFWAIQNLDNTNVPLISILLYRIKRCKNKLSEIILYIVNVIRFLNKPVSKDKYSGKN